MTKNVKMTLKVREPITKKCLKKLTDEPWELNKFWMSVLVAFNGKDKKLMQVVYKRWYDDCVAK